MEKLQCMWCRGEFDAIQGPVHEYIESTPGCWAAYSHVLAKEYADYESLGDIHRLTVDTYAVQHPGRPARRSIQSVRAHLVALHSYLVEELDGDKTRKRLKRFVERTQELHWLEPPDFTGSVTVSHVLLSTDAADHVDRVREWGRSVFARWYALHGKEIESMATARADYAGGSL